MAAAVEAGRQEKRAAFPSVRLWNRLLCTAVAPLWDVDTRVRGRAAQSHSHFRGRLVWHACCRRRTCIVLEWSTLPVALAPSNASAVFVVCHLATVLPAAAGELRGGLFFEWRRANVRWTSHARGRFRGMPALVKSLLPPPVCLPVALLHAVRPPPQDQPPVSPGLVASTISSHKHWPRSVAAAATLAPCLWSTGRTQSSALVPMCSWLSGLSCKPPTRGIMTRSLGQ